MSTRQLMHPDYTIAARDEGILITFRVLGSKFGVVEVILDTTEAEDFADKFLMVMDLASPSERTKP